MAAKSSGPAKNDTEAPKRRRTRRETVEPQETERGEFTPLPVEPAPVVSPGFDASPSFGAGISFDDSALSQDRAELDELRNYSDPDEVVDAVDDRRRGGRTEPRVESGRAQSGRGQRQRGGQSAQRSNGDGAQGVEDTGAADRRTEGRASEERASEARVADERGGDYEGADDQGSDDHGADDQGSFGSGSYESGSYEQGGDDFAAAGQEGDPNAPRRRRRRRRRQRGAGDVGAAPAPQQPRSQAPPRPQSQPRSQSQPRPPQSRPQSQSRPPSQHQQRPRRGGRPQQGQGQGQGHGQGQPRQPYNDGPTGREATPHMTGVVEGILELHPKGYGFLRDTANNYAAGKNDPFISSTLIEKAKLREGVMVRGEIGPGTKGQGARLRAIDSVDGRTVEDYMQLKSFDELTAINPFEQIKLETGPTPVTMRVMDLLTPIGKGQRALIVAPPRTGKTMLLQEIANAVSTNHPEVHLMVLLIDERPEEVTEMRRRIRGEVIASSMDRDVESHVRIAQLIVERGKRIAEAGGEVFVLLDSITRTARAFNKWVGNTGRTMSGGLDVKALDIPKKLFGTARRFDEGGSLTVVGTALIETGSRMDDIIFQEFKGTGNMELVLNRQLADRRIWPAIDVQQSGTRREEKILSPEVLEGVTLLRRSLASLNPIEAMEQLIKTLARFPSNKEFLAKIRSIM